MKSAVYQVIRRPIVTEKGLGVKELQRTVVFEVAPNATKTEIKEAVQQIFKVEGGSGAHGEVPRKVSAARARGRLPARLEKSVREAE